MFQSTHPHGVRPGKQVVYYAFQAFQSTHPHGVRRHGLMGLTSSSSFNPRTRTGCDSVYMRLLACATVSIHAPARGATGIATGTGNPQTGFNPRTRTGCDKHEGHRGKHEPCFNPRTRTGCDDVLPCVLRGEHGFQSTHPHGVRQA